ncbi:MAG: hypothetical protein PHY11_04895, partial [Bacilli bacterium]|nr:hypothetical protein [Bacilli bacterium]
MNKCNRVLCRVFGLISVFSFGLCLSISTSSTTHVHAESIDYASNFDLLNNSNNSAYYNASSCQPNKVSYTSIDTKGINRFYFSWLDDDLNVTNFYHPNISEYAGYTIMAHSNFITFDATHNYVYVVGEDNSSPGTYRYD